MEYEFKCGKCGKKAIGESAPKCCGHKMEKIPMDACTQAFGAENSRTMDGDEPCDDSRGG
mgnify:CR=1 FL=1